MINLQIRAGLWEQTLAVFAYARRHLFLTGRPAEICRRTAHIMDIPFKILVLDYLLCLIENRCMAAYLDRASLMKRECTKITAAKAPAVADK